MKILLIGHVCIDENISEHAVYTGWGSSLMYMSSYFRHHLDQQPVLFAPYGQDFVRYADGVKLLNKPLPSSTLIFRNHTRHGRRAQQCDHVGNAAPPPITKAIEKQVATADIICVAPLLPAYYTEYVAKLLAGRREDALSVILPQGYFRGTDADGHVKGRTFKETDLFSLFDLAIFSEHDHPKALVSARRWARQFTNCKQVLTQGPLGASWFSPDGTRHGVATIPVPEAEIVDSVGCGDTFSAAAMHDYFLRGDLPAAIKAGNEAARQKLFTAGQS